MYMKSLYLIRFKFLHVSHSFYFILNYLIEFYIKTELSLNAQNIFEYFKIFLH